MTIVEQIQRSAAAGVPHEEIATIFGVTLDEVRAAVAEQPEQPDDEPEHAEPWEDKAPEIWFRVVGQKQRVERVAASLKTSVAVVEATLAAVRKRRGEGRSRGPGAAINAAYDGNEYLKRRLSGSSRTADGDSVSGRRPGETDSEQYMREKYGRGRGRVV